MALPGGGIFVVKGEMSTLMTAMKRGVRWSSHSHQDDELDLLMRSFQDLKDVLSRIDDLSLVEPSVFLNPFLDVIRSEETSGPITSLALAAVNKFLSYRIIDQTHDSIPTIVDNIADAVTHARFEGTDHSSNSVVLMRMLQVLRTLTLSPEGAALTNDSLCEIMLSCFRICFETRLSELLRRTAEHYLKDMVQLVFMRLPQFPEDLRLVAMKQLKMKPGSIETSRSKRKHRTSLRDRKIAENGQTGEAIDDASSKMHSSTSYTNIVDMQGAISRVSHDESTSNLSSASNKAESEDGRLAETDEPDDAILGEERENRTDSTLDSEERSTVEADTNKSVENEETTKLLQSESREDDLNVNKETSSVKSNHVKEYVNPRGIRFTPQNQEAVSLIPYGLGCVREMFRFLITLCNPLDKQNTETMIHLGLSLLTVAFEVGADSIGNYSSLLALVKDELCRNLFSLLDSERLTVFAANLQVSFLMFESLRTHLKFQLEFYLTKLIDIITSDSMKVTYEHKELALDNIVQLWRIPGLVTELYLNYDCSLYCTNLYEDLTKLLAKNAFPATSGVYHTHLLSLDALLTVIESIEEHCNEKDCLKLDKFKIENLSKREGLGTAIGLRSRTKMSEYVPSREEMIKIKNIKRWLPTGTEYFNHKPKKGIQFLQEHGVLKVELDPQEIVLFLRDNPSLDKKMIGEYISSRNNLNILEAFVKMFDFTDLRIDEALRLYLETFRLPGEAPLISLVLEYFAEHWHKANGEPFANADAPFTLAYALIMLNVDQHNDNVKRQSTPMTVDGFKRNLKGVNGGEDFDQDMLNEIYNAIKNEEIVMPAEQTGQVRENYLWKVLLRRGISKDGLYIHTSNDTFDCYLFSLIWGPIVAALSFVYDKSEDPLVYKRAVKGFESCAFISSHFGLTQNLDMLVLTLCKFTSFHNQPKTSGAVQFGANVKAQIALRAVFNLIHQHGDNVREGWKNVFDLFLTLYNHNLLPKSYTEAEDFIEPSGKIVLVCQTSQSQKQDTGLLSSLYSYMLPSSESLSKIPTPEEQEYINVAKQCLKECNFDQLVTDSKFLHEDALLELVRALIELSRGPDIQKSLGYSYNENVAVFFLELLLRIVIHNRDRVMTIWKIVQDHLYTLVMNASHCDYQFLLERSVIGLLRLAIRLMRNEDMSPVVVQSLRMLLLLKSATLFRISRQISYGLYELLKTSAQNIHTSADWSIIFTLLECVGAGAQPPKPIVSEENQTDQGAKSEGEGPASSEEDALSTDRGYTSDSELTVGSRFHNSARSQSSPILPDPSVPLQNSGNNGGGGWILVGNEGEVQPVVGRAPPPNQYSLSLERNLGPHDPSSLIKCCESLAFLVRDVAHITPYNFDNCVHCIRTFVEASLNEGKRIRKASSRDSRNRKKAPSGRSRREQQPLRKSQSPTTSSPEEESDDEDVPSGYHQISIQLLDLMHTLHTRTAQIFRWWAEEGGEIAEEISLWTQGWCPLLQGIARLCCDTRRQVRMTAITYLQRALLVHDLQTLNGPEWEACFHRVLFPLLTQLLQPTRPRDAQIMEETRMRAATVLSKVFLHHLTPLLSLPTFTSLWLTILDYMDKYMHADNSDLLYEAIPESLKNMLLVMDSAKIFEGQDGPGQLWTITWERLATFLPHLKEELFMERETVGVTAKMVQEESLPPTVSPQLPVQQTPVTVIQHNIENATRSSIILQPPATEHNIASPLFAHLGQMVSTPIGAPPSSSANIPTYITPLVQPIQTVSQVQPNVQSTVRPPIPLPSILNQPLNLHQPYQPPNLFINSSNVTTGHTFPVLYKPTCDYVAGSLYPAVSATSTTESCVSAPPPVISQSQVAQVNYESDRRQLARTTTYPVLSTNLDIDNLRENYNFNTVVLSNPNQNTVSQETSNNENDSSRQTTNIFQSSNYFCSDNHRGDFITSNSDILFNLEKTASATENNVSHGSLLQDQSNIPVVSNLNNINLSN